MKGSLLVENPKQSYINDNSSPFVEVIEHSKFEDQSPGSENFSNETATLCLHAKNAAGLLKKQLRYCLFALSVFARRIRSLWPSLKQFMHKAVRDLTFPLHLHPVRMVFNAGSAETNAKFRLAGEAIAVCGEMKMGV